MSYRVYWTGFLKTFNKLKLRERQLITVASGLCIILIFLMFVWRPLLISFQQAGIKLQTTQQAINQTKQQIAEIKMAAGKDANKPYHKKIELLQSSIDKQQVKIENITAALINPKYMNQVFSALLQNSELEVNKVNNQPAEAVNIKGQAEAENLLYKHGLSLEMSGTFNNSLKYLQRVENQDWHLYWDELVYITKDYPQGLLTLNVHTLSTSDHVLGL